MTPTPDPIDPDLRRAGLIALEMPGDRGEITAAQAADPAAPIHRRFAHAAADLRDVIDRIDTRMVEGADRAPQQWIDEQIAAETALVHVIATIRVVQSDVASSVTHLAAHPGDQRVAEEVAAEVRALADDVMRVADGSGRPDQMDLIFCAGLLAGTVHLLPGTVSAADPRDAA
ncbi:hypothetical protein [Acidipropionibacterium acidipropionici]|uniref:hypothetical protein n=1 Tax=Acidipropionibacterium acidipropionici TaxID=1748 RepID=UPI00041EAE86|nr:hypothetical protein [Acidipropionibacterium acidipropionici]ALN14374.1 hypothetical protein ASQ49_02785 [Acidipropionibacterium acidipropionici]APZ09865.1 hypothetical protein BWX38_12165 [Acidipropionibacterium acidipropionici]